MISGNYVFHYYNSSFSALLWLMMFTIPLLIRRFHIGLTWAVVDSQILNSQDQSSFSLEIELCLLNPYSIALIHRMHFETAPSSVSAIYTGPPCMSKVWYIQILSLVSLVLLVSGNIMKHYCCVDSVNSSDVAHQSHTYYRIITVRHLQERTERYRKIGNFFLKIWNQTFFENGIFIHNVNVHIRNESCDMKIVIFAILNRIT